MIKNTLADKVTCFTSYARIFQCLAILFKYHEEKRFMPSRAIKLQNDRVERGKSECNIMVRLHITSGV